MTTDESIMEEMLDRATNPAKDTVDELGVQMFCIVVRSNAQLVQKAQEMIVSKVRSSNITEATRAIALLEECMTQCGPEFQDEAAKFRFLNELIRLVSKKYQGPETPHGVKQRIMECLLLWTTEFPQRQKIRDAYDMLRKEGEDIEHGQSAAAVGKRESVLGTMDEAMFAKLIKSNDPENFKRANLLLQYRMAQEARRNDLLAQHRSVLQEVQNTMQLLNQMLDSYDPSDSDVHETINELYRSCKKHRPIFQHLPKLLGDADEKLLADTLEANTALNELIARYKEVVPSPKKQPTTAASAASSTLTNPNKSASETAANNNTLLLNELLGDLLLNNTNGETAKTTSTPSTEMAGPSSTSTATETNERADALADLSDIFSSALAESESKLKQEPFQHSELLEPQVLSSIGAGDSLSNGIANDGQNKPGVARKMPQIDKLSDELFQQILPEAKERISTFKKEADKITLNDLARERMHVKPADQPTLPIADSGDHSIFKTLDDAPLLCAKPDEKTSTSNNKQETVEPPAVEHSNTPAPSMTIKHLSEIDIDLDSIVPTSESRIVLDDDDMQLSLNFTEDRPSKNVTVIVISAQNKSRQPVKDFQFEASVKKPCKVRLLPPTDNGMPAHKPFRPATPVNQVMLLLNPTGAPVDVTCIVGYRLGDDPDPIKESIVAKDLPFVQ
ncbi:ADP-ribosylation factor-binding protein GGA2 [Scaptodrosophila lebanonensis]|uniref:ADP-ribosylation factor-binding protein GGA2 n=1 Tax=Drosophila lebanonensis TaxID=7225 RepID=A0A6J2TTW0_DROLE|nr:ADP-ribosylation factor-binding protein GGA2 [Scaptodrosophila lebanonensis]